jgi:N-glycosylase/DNA lyase
VIELRTSQPTEEIRKRMIRVMSDVVQLKKLSAAEARILYRDLEATRDALSRILDRADGKSC